VITVVVLQNSMDILSGGRRSSNETQETSTVDGKVVTGIDAEKVPNISRKAYQSKTLQAIKTETVVSVHFL
jgi:hypothetical protein